MPAKVEDMTTQFTSIAPRGARVADVVLPAVRNDRNR